VPKIGCKDVAKCTHTALAPLRLGFSLILGLDSLGATINGQNFSPKDAAFFSNSLRQFWAKKLISNN
jgi:hypothetical protein